MINEATMRAQGDLVVPDPAANKFAIGTIQHYRPNTVPKLKLWAVAAGIYKKVEDVPKSNKPAHYFRRYRVLPPEVSTTAQPTTTDAAPSDAMIDREGHKDSEEWSEYTGTSGTSDCFSEKYLHPQGKSVNLRM